MLTTRPLSYHLQPAWDKHSLLEHVSTRARFCDCHMLGNVNACTVGTCMEPNQLSPMSRQPEQHGNTLAHTKSCEPLVPPRRSTYTAAECSMSLTRCSGLSNSRNGRAINCDTC
jgi:hypothetical protein